MMAALQRQQQKDSDDMIGKAMESKRSDIGVNLGKLQTIEANIRSTSEALSRADNLRDQQAYQAQLSALESARAVIIAEHHDRTQLMAASMNNYARNQPKPSERDIKNNRALALAQNAKMYAGYYLQNNPKIKSDEPTLALKNLNNPEFFKDYNPEDRMRAAQFIRSEITQNLRDDKIQADINKNRNQFDGLGTQINPAAAEENIYMQFGAQK